MSYNTSSRRRRAIPVPRELRMAPEPDFVPTIRQAPGTPWTPEHTGLPQIFPQRTFHTPQQQFPWANLTPARQPFSLPGNTPVWPSAPQALYQTPVAQNPPLPTFWEPGTFPVEPLGTIVPLRIHPHLIFNPLDPLIPVLQWDILHRAEQARVFTGRQLIVPVDLKAQAIMPNVRKIYITTDHPILQTWMESWGPIMIEKPKITICDILDTIYEYFQQPLTRGEYRRIKAASPENLASLVYAAHHRANDAYELYSCGLAAGFKRIDAMGGHRRFQGLRPVVFQDNTWKLFLGILPGPVPRVA